MKKLTVILLTGAMIFAVAACGKGTDTVTPEQNVSTEQESSMEASSEAADENTDTQVDLPAEESSEEGSSMESFGAVGILNGVWSVYAEDDLFAAAGGDADHISMDGPGIYGVGDADALDVVFGFPKDYMGKIDDGASLLHMMNANTFTSGAFHVIDKSSLADMAAALKDNLMGRQWVCGSPEKIVVASVDDYLVVFFGETQIMDTFKTHLMEVYPTAEIISEDKL